MLFEVFINVFCCCCFFTWTKYCNIFRAVRCLHQTLKFLHVAMEQTCPQARTFENRSLRFLRTLGVLFKTLLTSPKSRDICLFESPDVMFHTRDVTNQRLRVELWTRMDKATCLGNSFCTPKTRRELFNHYPVSLYSDGLDIINSRLWERTNALWKVKRSI